MDGRGGWALLTSIYTFRLVLIVFFGEAKQQATRQPGLRMAVPLVVLAALSLVVGLIDVPRMFGGAAWLSEFLGWTLPPTVTSAQAGSEWTFTGISAAAGLAGILLAYLFCFRSAAVLRSLAAVAPGRGCTASG